MEKTQAVAAGAARGGERRLPELSEGGGPAILPGGAAAPPRSRRARVKRLSLWLDPGRGWVPLLSLCLAALPGTGSLAAGGVSAAPALLLLRCPEGFLQEACACGFFGVFLFCVFFKEVDLHGVAFIVFRVFFFFLPSFVTFPKYRRF